MMGSRTSSSAVVPPMAPKRGFWFRKLSTAWWVKHPQADTGKHGGKKRIKNTYCASMANAKGSNDIPWDGSNTVRMECRMQQAAYLDCTKERGTDLTPRRTPMTLCRLNSGLQAPILYWDDYCKKTSYLTPGQKAPTFQMGQLAPP